MGGSVVFRSSVMKVDLFWDTSLNLRYFALHKGVATKIEVVLCPCTQHVTVVYCY